MPELEANGTLLYYEDTERGEIPIVFAHEVLLDLRVFDPQVEAFQNRYRCVRFDFRGQGRSAVTRGGYDMDTLYEDTIALIEKLALGPVHFVGLSMGGFIGMRLGARRPDLVRSLTLIGSSAAPESPDSVPRYRIINFVARWLGLNVVANQVMKSMFGRKFLNDPNRIMLRREMRRRLVGNHRLGITRAVRAVIGRRGMLEEIGRIRCPAMLLVGEQDTANGPDRSRQIQRHIGSAQMRIIPGAGHTATLEEPELVNIGLRDFLETLDGVLPELPPRPQEIARSVGLPEESPAEPEADLAEEDRASGTEPETVEAASGDEVATPDDEPAEGDEADAAVSDRGEAWPADRGTVAGKAEPPEPALSGAAAKAGARAAERRPRTQPAAKAKRPSTRKAAPKATAARKASARKATTKKTAAKKTAAKKTAARKTAARKPVSKKAASRKAIAKKTATKKPGSKKASKKTTGRATKKTAAKKTARRPAKKSGSRARR